MDTETKPPVATSYYDAEYPYLNEQETDAYNAERRAKAREKAEKMTAINKKATHNITLDFPARLGGEETTVIAMRRPTVRDRMVADKASPLPEERELTLFANLTGVSKDDLMSLDLSDWPKLQETLKGFLGLTE